MTKRTWEHSQSGAYFLTWKSDTEMANTIHSYHHPGKQIWFYQSEGKETGWDSAEEVGKINGKIESEVVVD